MTVNLGRLQMSETTRLASEAAVVAGLIRPLPCNGMAAEGGDFQLKFALQQVADLTLERDRCVRLGHSGFVYRTAP